MARVRSEEPMAQVARKDPPRNRLETRAVRWLPPRVSYVPSLAYLLSDFLWRSREPNLLGSAPMDHPQHQYARRPAQREWEALRNRQRGWRFRLRVWSSRGPPQPVL